MMTARFLILTALAGVMCMGWLQRPASQQAKRVIGQTETVTIAEASIKLPGRVDTGAASTSMHAESIRIDGNMVDFDLVSPDGRRVSLSKPIVKTATVRNAERSEDRIYVEMTIEHDGLAKQVLVNLNDRSGLTYPLLLGRNWLKDDFVVDVSREALAVNATLAGEPRNLSQLASQ